MGFYFVFIINFFKSISTLEMFFSEITIRGDGKQVG